MTGAEWASGQFVLFVLVFVRMSGLALFMPFFSDWSHPVQVKAGLAALLALLAAGAAGRSAAGAQPLEWGLGSFLWVGACELGVGCLMGLSVSMIFHSVELAGLLVGHDMGLAFANVVDPARDIEVSLIGQFKLLLVLAIFTALDGHHLFVRALARSYEVVPLGGLTISWALVNRLAAGFGFLFSFAVELASPIIVAGLLASVLLGFLGRTVPQMNILIVGFPLRIMMGFAVLLVMISLFVGVTERLTERSREDLWAVMRLMRPQAAGSAAGG